MDSLSKKIGRKRIGTDSVEHDFSKSAVSFFPTNKAKDAVGWLLRLACCRYDFSVNDETIDHQPPGVAEEASYVRWPP